MSSDSPIIPPEPQLSHGETVFRRLVKLLANALRKLGRLLSFQVTYPGVYIEEIPGGVHPIPGVPTSSTALSAPALCGSLSFVEFRFKEAAPQHQADGTDIACSVAVSCDGFTGRVESVWFTRDDIKRFLSELEEFEAKRRGSVSLLNYSSPSDVNPLTFEIISVDSVGHLIVRAALLKIRYLNGELIPLRVWVSFAVDAGKLRSMVSDFRKLFACREEGI